MRVKAEMIETRTFINKSIKVASTTEKKTNFNEVAFCLLIVKIICGQN